MAEYAEYGYWGLFFASFLAATILPLSSEAVLGIMLLGEFDAVACVIIATAGNWLGGMTSYFLGYLGKWGWIERWFHHKQKNLQHTKNYIDKYGSYSALFCWLPIFGDPLAIALGFVRSDIWKVSVYMMIGKLLRYMALTWLVMKGIEIAG